MQRKEKGAIGGGAGAPQSTRAQASIAKTGYKKTVPEFCTRRKRKTESAGSTTCRNKRRQAHFGEGGDRKVDKERERL